MLAMMMEASQHMSSLIRSLWFSLLPLVILAYHVFSYFPSYCICTCIRHSILQQHRSSARVLASGNAVVGFNYSSHRSSNKSRKSEVVC